MKVLTPLSQEQIISTWGNKTKPLVSVTIITYNHELYIEQAIMGVMAQVTNFPFEVIIHDDASTDNTQAIIKKYVQKYPQIIIPILQTENHWLGKGINATTTIVWPSAKGKYIAWLEGDDYWTDPYKLQKQVDFLEANPGYVLCFHKVKVLQPDGELADDFIAKVPENYETQETLARLGNYIHTPSVVFRNVIKEFPYEFSLTPIGDYFLYMLLGVFGKYGMINDEMAVYRNSVGVWSVQSNQTRSYKFMLTMILMKSCFQKANTHIFDILDNRIICQLKHLLNTLTVDEINSLRINSDISKQIDEYLLRILSEERNMSIGNISTKNICKYLLYRMKKKLIR
jgi:glycosyltransferase involved in cell wall biosynthesis